MALPQSPKKNNSNPERDAFIARFTKAGTKKDFSAAAKEVNDELVNEFLGLFSLQKRVLSNPQQKGYEARVKYFEPVNGVIDPYNPTAVFRIDEGHLVELALEHKQKMSYLKSAFVAARKRGRNLYHASSFKSGYAIQAAGQDVQAFVAYAEPIIARVLNRPVNLVRAKQGFISANAFQDLFLLVRAEHAKNAGANTPLGQGYIGGVAVDMSRFFQIFSSTPSPFSYYWGNAQLQDTDYSEKTPEGKKHWHYRHIRKEDRTRVPNFDNVPSLLNLKYAEPGRLVFPTAEEEALGRMQGGATYQSRNNLGSRDATKPIDWQSLTVGAFPQFMFRMFSALVLVPGPEAIEKVLAAADRTTAAANSNYANARAVAKRLSDGIASAGLARDNLVGRDANGKETVVPMDDGSKGNTLTANGQELVNEYELIAAAKKILHKDNDPYRAAKTKAREAQKKAENDADKLAKKQARAASFVNYAGAFQQGGF